MANLEALIWSEGFPGSPVLRIKVRQLLQSSFTYVMSEAKSVGYKEAVSLQRNQIEDLEELLDEEIRKRKILERERMKLDEEIREMVREEMEMVLGKLPRRWEEERIWKGSRGSGKWGRNCIGCWKFGEKRGRIRIG